MLFDRWLKLRVKGCIEEDVKRTRHAWVLGCLLACNSATTQIYQYKHSTIDNGLVSHVVYAAYCDSLDNMWFGTDHSVQKYDGKSFSYYLSNEQYRKNEVYETFDGADGDICNKVYIGFSSST